MRRPSLAVAVSVMTAATIAALNMAGAAAAESPHGTLDIQLLAINDFHGGIEPTTGENSFATVQNADGTLSEVPAGGAAYMATHLKNARAGQKHTITVGAGDMISKSAMMPTILHQEPTIGVLDAMGLEVTSVGNHEFDQGLSELLRLKNGGCHPVDGCRAEDPYPGARFEYLAANVIDDKTQKPVLPSYWVKDFGGVSVGFIGMTLQNSPAMGRPSNYDGLTLTEEVVTANRNAAELRAQGVSAIVLLIHEGGSPTSKAYNYDCNVDGKLNLTGPIVKIAQKVDPAIDVIVSGHTHKSYVCEIPDPNGRPRLVTSAGSHGRAYTDITLQYNPITRGINQVTASNKIVTRDVPADPDMSALIDKYNAFATRAADKPIGHIAGDIRRTSGIESPMGDLVADAQLAATAAPDKGGAQIAFLSPLGIHADLLFDPPGGPGNGVITYGKALMTQPYKNPLVTRTLTGEQIIDILRHQYTVSKSGTPVPEILQVSRGFTYTLTGLDDVSDVKLNGVPLDPAGHYRVTANGHLATSKSNTFTDVFSKGTDETTASYEDESVVTYLLANSSAEHPLPVPTADRIAFSATD